MGHRQVRASTRAVAHCCLALVLALSVPVPDSRALGTTAPGITVTPSNGGESGQASSGSTLTFVSSTAVTPTADFSNGDFVRIFQRGTKVLVTFSTSLASALIPGTCPRTEPQSGAYVYREYSEDMTPTGKQGVIACGVKGDNGGLLVGDKFYLALSGVDDPVLDGWSLSMYDSTSWSTLPAPPTSPLVGPTSHLLECGKGAGDPMLVSVYGLIDIDGKYIGSGCCGSSQPSYCQPGPTYSFTTHHNFFDPATFSVASCPPSCPLILPVPPNPGHIDLTSLIVDDDTIDFLSSTSILGDLVLMRLDSDWHYLSSSVLRPHAWCPEGVASYGGHYFVSFLDSSNCSGTLDCQMNVRLAVFDREWTPVEEVAVTSFAQGSQMDVQKPTILLEGDKLYVAYLSGPFGVAGANQVSVALFQLATPQTTCSSFTIEPTSTSPTASAGSKTVTVTGSPSGCTGGDWTASGNGSWLSISAANGTGSGSVTVSWEANTSASQRTGTATIAGSTFTVTQAGSGTTTPLMSDWVPCTAPGGAVGGPGEDVQQPSRTRVLIARSQDGLHFERPSTDAERFLLDQADIPDAVVLPSGRVLVYFMAGCRDYSPSGGSKTTADAIAVAVSDSGGAPGSWVFKDVTFDNAAHGLDRPFDPNIVLWKPEENLFRIFVSQAVGGASMSTHSYTSTDGFTFTYEGKRYDPGPPDGVADPEDFRFDATHWYIFTGGPNGVATSSDDGTTFTRLGSFDDLVTNASGVGVVHEVAVTDIPGTYRAFTSALRLATGMTGVNSLTSTAGPWTSWQYEGPVLDVAGGIESCEVRFPTVVRLAADNWLMFYGTNIPNCVCGNEGSLFHCTPPASVPPCYAFTISPTSATATASSGSQQVTITGAPSGCAGGSWTASASASWLSVSAASGTGSGSVTVSWTQSTDWSSRTGTATIGGQSFTVTQAGSSHEPHVVRRHLQRPDAGCPGPLAPLGVLRSNDHGATWVSLGNACMQGSVVHAVDPAGLVVDGKVILYVVDFDRLNQNVPQTIYRTVSTDGVSFTTPVPVYSQPRTMVDPTVVRLADGSYRMYVTSDQEGIISATSADGLAFTREAGVRLGYGAGGMIGGLLLPDQRLRLFLNGTLVQGGPEGIFSMISTDGLALTRESGFRITPPTGRQAVDAGPIRLHDGGYLMSYEVFDDGMMDHPDPWTFTEIHLAMSADGFNWTPAGGVIGHGGTQTLVEMPDGTLLIYFVNQ